jgi:hypothetical protein
VSEVARAAHGDDFERVWAACPAVTSCATLGATLSCTPLSSHETDDVGEIEGAAASAPPTAQAVLFDTNVLRDLQRGRLDRALVRRATDRLTDGSVRGFFSPLTLLELGSHFTDDERRDFPRYQGALRAARRLGLHALPSPETFLRAALASAEPAPRHLSPTATNETNGPSETDRLTRLLAGARSYEELVYGQRITWAGVRQRVAFVPGSWRTLRDEGEAHFVNSLDEMRRRLACLEPTTLLERLRQAPSRRAFERAQRRHHGLVEKGPETATSPCLEPLFRGWSSIVEQLVAGHYDPRREVNDHHDLGLLAYLAAPGMTLVTSDRGFTDKLGATTRIQTFEGWSSGA